MALVVDIETAGHTPEDIPSRAMDYLLRRLQRDDPTGEELEARRKDMVEKFGLDPTTGRIVCIGLLDTESGAEEALGDEEEANLLTSFWDFLGRTRPELFVTFNGKRFDFPFINIRSAILEILPSTPLPSAPHTTHPHFDVREVLAGDDRYRKGSLDYFCAVFGIPSPKESLDGARVGEAFRQGRLEEIARYCLADCRATAALYERLRPFYPSQP
ncbi:MAG: ribonuclease H-like domain-containing protein [Acidobacteriota bacterium]